MVFFDIDPHVVETYRSLGYRAYVGDLRFLKNFVLPEPFHFICTYHIESYQTEAIVDFVDNNLLPYGVWVSYLSFPELERGAVLEILKFIERRGFIVHTLIRQHFVAIKIPYPERELLWRREY